MRIKRRNFIQKKVRSDPHFKTKAHKTRRDNPRSLRINVRNWEIFED